MQKHLNIAKSPRLGVDPSARMEELRNRMVEIHTNGVCQYWAGLRE
ncbi:MAG: hypothetical protein ACETWE_04355 [Candidatus Bathyarchaeia archaeon]